MSRRSIALLLVLTMILIGFAGVASASSHEAGVALYDQATRLFYVKDDSSAGPADRVFAYGPLGNEWLPAAGDWNGDGYYGVALYDQANRLFYIKDDATAGPADDVFAYGSLGNDWLPVAGDWNGDGQYGVALYDQTRGLFLIKETATAGTADRVFRYGPEGNDWLPVAGDWNGDGNYGVGLYDQADRLFYIKDEATAGIADRVFAYGPMGNNWLPVAADWNGDGNHGIALYNQLERLFYVKDSAEAGIADRTFAYGWIDNSMLPVAGNWAAPAPPPQGYGAGTQSKLFEHLSDEKPFIYLENDITITQSNFDLFYDDLILNLNGHTLYLNGQNMTISGNDVTVHSSPGAIKGRVGNEDIIVTGNRALLHDLGLDIRELVIDPTAPQDVKEVTYIRDIEFLSDTGIYIGDGKYLSAHGEITLPYNVTVTFFVPDPRGGGVRTLTGDADFVGRGKINVGSANIQSTDFVEEGYGYRFLGNTLNFYVPINAYVDLDLGNANIYEVYLWWGADLYFINDVSSVYPDVKGAIVVADYEWGWSNLYVPNWPIVPARVTLDNLWFRNIGDFDIENTTTVINSEIDNGWGGVWVADTAGGTEFVDSLFETWWIELDGSTTLDNMRLQRVLEMDVYADSYIINTLDWKGQSGEVSWLYIHSDTTLFVRTEINVGEMNWFQLEGDGRMRGIGASINSDTASCHIIGDHALAEEDDYGILTITGRQKPDFQFNIDTHLWGDVDLGNVAFDRFFVESDSTMTVVNGKVVNHRKDVEIMGYDLYVETRLGVKALDLDDMHGTLLGDDGVAIKGEDSFLHLGNRLQVENLILHHTLEDVFIWDSEAEVGEITFADVTVQDHWINFIDWILFLDGDVHLVNVNEEPLLWIESRDRVAKLVGNGNAISGEGAMVFWSDFVPYKVVAENVTFDLDTDRIAEVIAIGIHALGYLTEVEFRDVTWTDDARVIVPQVELNGETYDSYLGFKGTVDNQGGLVTWGEEFAAHGLIDRHRLVNSGNVSYVLPYVITPPSP